MKYIYLVLDLQEETSGKSNEYNVGLEHPR